MDIRRLVANKNQIPKRTWLCSCLGLLLFCNAVFANADLTIERRNKEAIAKVKAAYIYNFLKYVELKNNMPTQPDTFNVCIFGENPFGKALHNMNGRQAQGIQVKVLEIEQTQQANICHIIYISESKSNDIATLLSAIQERPILTVSDIANFSNIGGVIGFTQTKEKIGIEININNARKAKIKISALLLEIAKIIQ